MKHLHRIIGWCVVIVWSLMALGAQSQTVSVSRAGSLTELPSGAWGPYARLHAGPCYLADRLLAQLFSFPIVIGQRREELILKRSRTEDGKTLMRPERAILERRAMGLSPMQAATDDLEKEDQALINRHARVQEADAEGLLWSAQIPFLPAGGVQEVVAPPDASTHAGPADWGAGLATVACFPAFADPAADGLLIRVTLTNRSSAPQTYYVDLLGGMGLVAPEFVTSDLTIEPGDKKDDGVIVQHAKCPTVFALTADASRYADSHFVLRYYRVSDAYFAPAGATTRRDPAGIVLPAGLLSASSGAAAASKEKGGKKKQHDPLPPDTEPDKSGQWGLTRVDDIALAPGETITLFLCVGVGKDKDAARDSAQTLLSLADDAVIMGQPRVGAYTSAQSSHKKERFTSGDSALDQLMAQAMTNIPFVAFRRIGVPSREDRPGRMGGSYQGAEGGNIALGWTAYRPDWAAAQLNAWFLTRSDPNAPLSNLQAVPPTNLFALWELYQRTHDRVLLENFYPFVRRHYRELLAAGRPNDTTWLFSWTSAVPGGHSPQIYAPDYSAYVIRTAKILRRIAEEIGQHAADVQGYDKDIAEATSALNSTLWDAGRGLYISKAANPDDAAKAAAPASLANLLPLITGTEAVSPERRAVLLKTLTDPATFWSEAGLRSVSKSDPAYRSAARNDGAISFGLNWMLWKALLDCGETATAHKLADTLLSAYHKAQVTAGFCPEWLDGDTGAAGGVTDYSGDACALLALYAAYHRPGTISTDWDTMLLDSRYDAAADTLHVTFHSPTPTGRSVLLCVLGKPNGSYRLAGAITGSVTADADGVLTLMPPTDSTTRQLDIVPAAAPGATPKG